MKRTTDSVLIIGTVIAIGALGFLAGFIFRDRPETVLAVNESGNLERRIADQ